jgi:hypothetical protein
MKVSRQTILDAPAERIIAEVSTSRLLRYVAWPMQSFAPIAPEMLPDVWSPGRYRVRMRSLGVLPTGWQDIVIEHPPADRPGRFHIRDNGSGQLVRRWDHLITIDRRPDGRTDYRDEVDVDAGALTPLIAGYAAIFYAHRQRRWRRLVRNQFDYSK